jgi:hypothetical protein
MRKQLSIGVFLLLLCAGSIAAQAPETPNFSGKWVFVKSTSLYSSKILVPAETKYNAYVDDLVIEHTGPEVRFHRNFRYEYIDNKKSGKHTTIYGFERKWTFFSDGRGDENGPNVPKSVSNWKGQRLVTVFYSEPGKKGKQEKSGTIEIELADNGKTLIVWRKGFEESEESGLLNVFEQNRRDYYKLQ